MAYNLIASDDHLHDLFNYVNSHLTLIESNMIYKENKRDIKVDLFSVVKPKKLDIDEYLNRFMAKPVIITTKMVGKICPICLDLFVPEQFYRRLNCQHVFHQNCIELWFDQNMDDLECPLCRQSQYDEIDQSIQSTESRLIKSR